MQKTNKNRTREHHHQILHIQNSLGIKFQLKLTILNVWTKLIQQEYIQSKKEKLKITIEFCIFELVPNFSFSKQLWRLKEFCQTSILPSKNRKNQRHYWILHIPISFNIKFHFKQTILDFEITFAQNRYFQQKTKKCTSLFNTAYWNYYG